MAGIKAVWRHVSLHLPQPQTDREALVAIHYARTLAQSIPFKLRAYSHRYLLDNGFSSGLPDDFKPKAERIYPRIVEGVGIAVRAASEYSKLIAPVIQGAMSDAVSEAYADGLTDPAFVSQRMKEARERVLKRA